VIAALDLTVNLREQVEQLLPGWESWYPSLFDAARDLGLIRARVCSPSSLLLSSRHSAVRQDAQNAHREQWGGTGELVRPANQRKRRRRKRPPA
jgi:hypothetical protein